MDQLLDICKWVYEIATYNMRRVCVTISFYIVNKPPYIRIRLIAAKENEGLKHVAYINYTLNELSQILDTLCLLITVRPSIVL